MKIHSTGKKSLISTSEDDLIVDMFWKISFTTGFNDCYNNMLQPSFGFLANTLVNLDLIKGQSYEVCLN